MVLRRTGPARSWGFFLVGEHLAAPNTPERGGRIPLVATEADGVLGDGELLLTGPAVGDDEADAATAVVDGHRGRRLVGRAGAHGAATLRGIGRAHLHDLRLRSRGGTCNLQRNW